MAKGNASGEEKRKTPHVAELLSNGGDTNTLKLTLLDPRLTHQSKVSGLNTSETLLLTPRYNLRESYIC
jgi:hypothetical protein